MERSVIRDDLEDVASNLMELDDPPASSFEVVSEDKLEELDIRSEAGQMQSREANPMVLPRFVSNSLYIADLDATFANQGLLFDLFSQVGTVLSVRVCTNSKQSDRTGNSPLTCHAYINFNTVEEACHAWETLNYKDMNGTPMRIMFSNLDPASRYNPNANLIIKNLEESIDSEALHHTFSAFGVVLSCKVKRDSSGKSLGYGFIQFQEEEDAQRAITLVNGKLLEGQQVYLGPFIPRSVDSSEAAMNLNPLDLNPAHNSPLQFTENVPYGIGNIIDEVEYCSMSSTSNTSTHSSNDEARTGNEDDYETARTGNEGPIKKGRRVRLTSSQRCKARRIARAAEIIEAARAAIIAEKRAAAASAMPYIDPTYVPSSEPWAPQPWSVKTLLANLSSAYLPEEGLAMLGGTLLPLVCNYTKNLASDVTNELVKMDIKDIVHLMKSAEALRDKVEETKQMILEKILNQPPYVPQTASPPPAANNPIASVDSPRPAPVAAESAVAIPVATVAVLPSLSILGKFPFQKGTGFFDVSRAQLFAISEEEDEYQDELGYCLSSL